MNNFAQYGDEEPFLEKFFNSKENGFLVDIGAADGVKHSASRHLILNRKWKGILVEPHPEYFKNLEELYKNDENIKLYNNAAFIVETTLPFYIYNDGDVDSGQSSTISEQFKHRVASRYGNYYNKTVNVQTLKLSTILKDVEHIDYLSIDCEGADIDVINSNDFTKTRPTLIGVEHSMDEKILHETMGAYEYTLIFRSSGNSFFVQK